MYRSSSLTRLLLLAVLSATVQHYITAAVSLPITTGSSGNVGDVLAGKIHPDAATANAMNEDAAAGAASTGDGRSSFELVRRRTNFRGDLGKRIGSVNSGRRGGSWNPFSTGRLRPDLGKRAGSSEMAEANLPWTRIQRGSDPLFLAGQRPSSRRRLRPDLGKRSEGDWDQLGDNLRGYLWLPSVTDLSPSNGLQVDDIRPDIAQRLSDIDDDGTFGYDDNDDGNIDVDDDVLEQAAQMIQRRALTPAAGRSGSRANHFRGDLGKRRPANTFRGDLGKRADESVLYRRRRSIDATDDEQSEGNSEVEPENTETGTDLDWEKRAGRSGKSFRGDLGKRRNSFRGDLGKRSRGSATSSDVLSEVEEPDSLYDDNVSAPSGGEAKRKQSKSFRGDLGKRSRSEDGNFVSKDGNFQTYSSSASFVKRPRQHFRGDLGKRTSTAAQAEGEAQTTLENESD